jgi:LysR family transcriptional regulator, transcriptional activator for bauABCD operon
MAKTLPTPGDGDIRLLRVFRAVVDSGGVTAAETALNVGRSTISAQLAALEDRLGMRLCERGRRGFALTEGGQRVYEAAVRLFGSLEDFRAAIGAAEGRLTGELAFGYPDQSMSSPDLRLAETFRRFRDRAPGVRLNLRVTSLDEIERAVLGGRLHVGLVIHYRRVPGLDYSYLLSEEQGLFCGKGHPLFERPQARIALSDIAEADYVGRGYLDEARFRSVEIKFRPAAIAYHAEAAAHLILSGRFIGFLPLHYGERWVRAGEMRPLRPEKTTYKSEFHVATRRGAAEMPVISTFLAEFFHAHGKGGNGDKVRARK